MGKLFCKVLKYGLLLGVLNPAALATADSEEPKDSGGQSPNAREKLVTPMTDRGSIVAPYSVRFRITGYLARQHARDGKTLRSLVEFYSMLDTDDPSWPDDEQGDSMRIGRDIEVAQMMTEAGFFDHAVRILQTSLILASINHDPQASQVELQMRATADLARVKRVLVPDIDMSFLAGFQPLQPATSMESVVSQPASPVSSVPAAAEEPGPALSGEPVTPQQSVAVHEYEPTLANQSIVSQSAAAEEEPGPALGDQSVVETSAADQEPGPSLSGQPVVPATPLANPPNELPPMRAEPILTHEAPLITGTTEEEKPEGRSRWSWLSPSRWWQKKEITPVEAQEEVAPERPATSPNVSPTYCQECSGLHGHRAGSVVVRYNPRTGITHTHIPGGAPASPVPSPYQKNFAPLKPENQARAGAGMLTGSTPEDHTGIVAEQTTKAPRATNAARVAPARTSSVPDDAGSHDRSRIMPEPVAKTPRLVRQTAEHKVAKTPPHVPEAADRRATEPPAPRELAQPTAAGWTPTHHTAQVGIAGEVSNPGIFPLRGKSTTLAALLRRTGEREISSEKKARILRSVQLHEGNSSEPSKDIYCQRLNSLDAKLGALETPVYGQEVVIVDGTGERPIYVAVMPHFILQLPFDPHYGVTADQIIDQLSEHWPNIRNQSIGILRYEQWGSATSVVRLDEADETPQTPLAAGDVVYVDGISLDRSQVLSAAESIASMAGARIRKHEASATRAAGSK
jgi:hypothetical protein